MKKWLIGFLVFFVASLCFAQTISISSYSVTVNATYTYQNNKCQEVSASFSYTLTKTGAGTSENERKKDAEWSAKNYVERYAKEDLASRSDSDFLSKVRNLKITSVSSYKE